MGGVYELGRSLHVVCTSDLSFYDNLNDKTVTTIEVDILAENGDMTTSDLWTTVAKGRILIFFSDTLKLQEIDRIRLIEFFGYVCSNLIGRAKRDPPYSSRTTFSYNMYIYIRTFLICVHMLVICDRNSIATKREEFPARVVEVASSRLHFASLARLLQQIYLALCQQRAWNSVLVYY